MTTATSILPAALSPRASAELGARLNDSARLAAVRAAGAAASDSLGLPTRIDRPWKYLDLADLTFDSYAPAPSLARVEPVAELKMRYGISESVSALLLQVDGETVHTQVGAAGLTLADFRNAPGAAAEAVETHLGTVVSPNNSVFSALHYAFLNGGVIIRAAPGFEAASPVRIVRDYRASGQLATPHTLIVTGANSRVNIIEDLRSGPGDIIALPAVEVVPGPGSEVRYTVLHRWGAQTRVFSDERMVSERDSALINLSLATGGAVVKSHIESSLEGRGSSSELYALCLGDAQQHVNFYTVQDHIAADTRSDLMFKSALKERSRSVYYGLTRVGLGARNADANQENRNLLLSHEAKADSDPVLEILTNDVIRVSHGATAGPVDEEQLYYLQARGIPRDEAEALLVWAFLSEVLDRVPDDALREELSIALHEKLEARP